MIDAPVLSSISEATFLDLALYYGLFIIFYFTANASSLLILFKYARVETTCHFLMLLVRLVFFGCLTATFRSVSALRYGILPFWRDRNCLVQSKS